MEIEYVILGLLSLGPRSGYDIKKEVSRSRVFYWSGNSNQIYRGLLRLSESALVQSEVVQAAAGPSKKVFEITQLGKERLRSWLLSDVEAPEIRNAFLMRLSFAANLNTAEINAMLLGYSEHLQVQAKMLKEVSARRQSSEESPKAQIIAGAIDEYQSLIVETELTWLRRLRSQFT